MLISFKFVQVDCILGEWIQPNLTWPNATSACTVMGDPCIITANSSNILPSFLAFQVTASNATTTGGGSNTTNTTNTNSTTSSNTTATSTGTMILSGNRVDLTCSNKNKVLTEDYIDLSLECYDGSFVKIDFPDYSACKDPSTCVLSQLDNLSPSPPSYLTLMSGNATTIIPHKGLIQFTCANGKNLTSDIDPVRGSTNMTSHYTGK